MKKDMLGLLAAAAIAVGCAFIAGQASAKQTKYPLGDIALPDEIYKKYLKASGADTAEALPTSYDARAHGLVTPAKDQGSCGSCWAFASVGALESHLLKAYQVGPESLSEQQQVSCNTAMYGCAGGSSTAIRYWESKGPEAESYFPYTAVDTTACKEEQNAQLGYRVTDWHTVPAAASDFKTSLYTEGPSYFRFDVHYDFYTYWNSGQTGQVYVNTIANYQGGHAVLLIGWDDSKGAYLCKNSWGETGGPNGDGTFWLAYSGHVNNLNFGMVNFSLTSLSCSLDSDCDDGVYCNGQETCVNNSCQAGAPITCTDDGIFCDGSEACNEATQGCVSTGNPCGANMSCNEGSKMCIPTCLNRAASCRQNSDCCSGRCNNYKCR